MEKDRKEFQAKMAGILTEAIGNETRLETEKVVFLSNIKNGSHLYIDPLVDTVKKTLKQKNSLQTKFNALMLLKEAMDTRNKELAKYVTTKILDRLKAIAKQSIKPDKNKFFTPQALGDDFYLLLLECLFNWSIFFQLPADQKMQPSAFKIACSELQQAGIRFPTQFKYFAIAEPLQQSKKESKKESKIILEKKQEIKKQEPPKQTIQTPSPDDNFKKAEETFKGSKSFLSMLADILRENEDISCIIFLYKDILDLTPSLKDLTGPISEDISELSADDDPRAEQLVGDLIRLGEFINDLIKDLDDCTRKKMQLTVFKKKYHPQIQKFVDSLQYQEAITQKVEEPKTTFQEEVVQASKQVIENDNPFVFNQVANFDQQEIERTQQELQKQKILLPQPEQKQQKQEQSQQEQVPQLIAQKIEQQIEQQQAQMAFGFDQFAQQSNDPQNQPAFDPQWGGINSGQPAELAQPFGLPQENEKQIDLPFDQKGSDRDQFQSQWEITNQQPQPETEWNPGWNNWQTEKENQMNEEVIEKQKPTLPQVIKKQSQQEVELLQAPRKKKNNPFERQSSKISQGEAQTNPWNENNQDQADTAKSKDDFAGFSKIMDNKSDYKTDMDSKPFSNVFGFGDDLGDLNLENMAGSSKMSKQDRSKSFESEQGKAPANQFFQPNAILEKEQIKPQQQEANNEWQVKNTIANENQFSGFPFVYKNNDEQKEDFVDPYQQSDVIGWKLDEFENKPRKNLNVDQNLSNINKDDEKSENQDSPNPFKDSNDFKFDLNKLPKHSLHVMSQRQLQYCSIKGISIIFNSRKVDAEVQVAEQQTTILKYNPQQEIQHQKEKQALIKELQELRYLKNENEQDLNDQKKIIETYQKQFKQYKSFEIRMTEAYQQLNKQFSNLNDHYKQLKENYNLQSEEINKISLENAQLNEQYTYSIKELSDSKSNEESLLNRLRIIEKQFQSIRMDHKCPIQLYLLQYIKSPNLIETEMPNRLSLIQNGQQDAIKSQKIVIKYDPCLFMDIQRGCVQPFSNDINDLKYSFLLPRAILYEDSIIQIGVISKQLSGDLSVQLHIKNKSDQNLVIQKIKLTAPSNNQLNKFDLQNDSVLQKKTTFKISLKFQYQEFMKQPILEFTANSQDYHILLPVSIIKFATSELLDVISIREKWKGSDVNKTIVKSVLEQPNPKLIGCTDDFLRYFPSLVKFENKLIMEIKIDQFDFGIQFYETKSQVIIKVQTSSLLRTKAEQLLQNFLFLFNL